MNRGALHVGIIGAGGRVKENYLPALRLMPDEFNVKWVHARNQDRLRAAMAPWGVRTIASIDTGALDEVDVVAVSVPADQNAAVLRKIGGAAKRLHLVIDTPVAASIGQARALWPLLRRFASVTVTEDFMNFPDFDLVRKAVADGAIGKVRNVILDGLGYYYHGLALIRSFADFSPVRSTARQRLGGDFVVSRYRLASGLEGTILYPYRRYDGTVGIVGSDGTIVSSEDAIPFVKGKRNLLLAAERQDGLPHRITLKGPDYFARTELPLVPSLMALPFQDRSELNLMRTLGLMTVFRSLDNDNINRRYGYGNALHDSFMSKVGMRFPRIWDPLSIVGASTIGTGLAIIGR